MNEDDTYRELIRCPFPDLLRRARETSNERTLSDNPGEEWSKFLKKHGWTQDEWIDEQWAHMQ